MTTTGMETITPVAKVSAPWGKEIDIRTVDYDGGLRMMRLTIRENKRFTTLDLDADTALALVGHLGPWAAEARAAIDAATVPAPESDGA